MGRLDRSYLEGMTREDARALMLLLEGRAVAQDLLDRFCLKGWIESSPQGHLITWAGRCVVESLNTPKALSQKIRAEHRFRPSAKPAAAS